MVNTTCVFFSGHVQITYVCLHITSVYPSLRCCLCFFGLFFSLHHWFTAYSTPETKIVENNINSSVCLHAKLVN